MSLGKQAVISSQITNCAQRQEHRLEYIIFDGLALKCENGPF